METNLLYESYHKFVPINLCVFNRRTFQPNFIPIRFEMMELLAFFAEVAPAKQQD